MIWVTARSLVDAKLGAKRFCPSRPLFLLLKYDSRWASGISLLLSLSIAYWLSSSWPNRSAALPHDWWSICKWFNVDVEGLPLPIVGPHKYVKAFFRTKAVSLSVGPSIILIFKQVPSFGWLPWMVAALPTSSLESCGSGKIAFHIQFEGLAVKILSKFLDRSDLSTLGKSF